MYITGSVTKINLQYCTFEIEKEITVLAAFFIAYNHNFLFPNLGSVVVIYDGLIHNKILILGPNSKILCSNYCSELQEFQCEYFINLVKKYPLNLLNYAAFLKRILEIDKLHLFPNFFLKLIDWKEDFSFLDIIVNLIPLLEENLNQELFETADFKILMPSDFANYLHKRSLQSQKFVYGVKSYKNNEYLFGYLRVSSHTNYLSIMDLKYGLKCEISSENKAEYSKTMSNLLNKFVVIKNFTVFNEYTPNTDVLQYLFVNIKNIHVIHERQINEELNPSEKSYSVFLKLLNQRIVCVKTEKVIKKAMRIIETSEGSKTIEENICQQRDMFQSWLLCTAKYDEEFLGTKFLVLHGKNFEKYPLFNCGDMYLIETDDSEFLDNLISDKNETFYNLDSNKVPVIKIPEDSTFNFLGNDDTTLETFDDIRPQFGHNSKAKTYSFEGIIAKRSTAQFANQEIPKNVNCGIKGDKSQQILIETQKKEGKNFGEIFDLQNIEQAEKMYEENEENFSNSKIDSTTIYLKNWANVLTPLGIIDNMKVAIRLATNPKNKNYLRTYFATTFEPLEYCPKRVFQTTLEILRNNEWGPPVSLSDSVHIPAGCLCWGETLLLKFTTFNIQSRCNKCNKICDTFVGCCGAPKLHPTIGLRGRDPHGGFDSVSNEENILKVLFGLKDIEFEYMKKIFLILKKYSVSFKSDDYLNNFSDEFQRNAAELIKCMVINFNRNAINNFDIKGRKMSKNLNDFNCNQKWYPVEFRNKVKSEKFNIF